MDPNPLRLNNQTGPQPGTSGQMSKRLAKYLSMEYITPYLKSTEYEFLRELSSLIQTSENAHGISCITNLPDATFVCIRQEPLHFGLSVKKIQRRIAFHVLAIWYILANGVLDRASLIKDMFYDLELDEECEDVFDKFPWVTSERDRTGAGNKASNISLGTKLLGKGQKSKSSTTVGQGNCSSTNPLNPIRENGKTVGMEEQMLELVENVENDDSGTSEGQQSQPFIIFGQVCLNNMRATSENLGQSINVTFTVDNEILEIPLQTHMYS